MPEPENDQSYESETPTISPSYRKASEGDDVVKNKLFPKNGKIEINGLNVGAILNESYLTTYLLHGGLTYFPSETWGFGIEGLFGSSRDSDSRYCIEHFYNDPGGNVGPGCDYPRDAPGANIEGAEKANYGPAYVPIREVKYAVAATAIWNPVYGKQLFLLSATGYFDLFLTMGAGMLISDFYPLRTVLNNGKITRGSYPADGSSDPIPGADAKETGSYGVLGRPASVRESTFMITTGIGQKYHFAERFNLKVELRNYLLVGTASGFDLFLTLWGGVGVRI
jgi:outer membrane beta-barrel protein